MSEKKPSLLIIVGATASGKSGVAIELAKRLNGEIISADSRSFFSDLEIGTAKPSAADLLEVPHHLVKITTLNHPWSLGEFTVEVKLLIADITARGKLPILVGGSGQYIRSIVENWQVPTQEPDNQLRDVLTHWGNDIGFDQLHAFLATLDSVAAKGIDSRNARRTVRALEVIFLSGKKFSEQRSSGESDYNYLILGLDWPRELLYQRVDERIEQMMSKGLVEETRQVVNSGKGSQLRKIGIIGYAEILDYLDGRSTLNEAVRLIKRNTRRFIRHQSNWFKPDNPEIHWYKMQDPTSTEKMLGLINEVFSVIE